MSYRLKIIICLVGCVLASTVNAEVQYQFHWLDSLGGSYSVANDINDAGQVVGTSTLVNSGNHATLWQDGSVIDLGTAGGTYSYANAINNAGQIAGYANSPENPARLSAILWNNSISKTLYTDVSHDNIANGINDAGVVVGESFRMTYIENRLGGSVEAVVWTGGSSTELAHLGFVTSYATDINNSDQIVGYSSDSVDTQWHAVLWSNGNVTDLNTPAHGVSIANSINDSGQIVGTANKKAYGSPGLPFLWSDGTMTELMPLIGLDSGSAQDINNAGLIVGASRSIAQQTNRATLWQDEAAIDLNTFLPADYVEAGWVLDYATAINSQGSIVGYGRNSSLENVQRAFLLSVMPVPEASTFAMLCMGLGCLAGVARRRSSCQCMSN